MNIKKFFNELQRRNVFKVATAYAIAGWLIIQVAATIAPQLNFPEWVPAFITIITLCGFPIALIIAWAFELTPDGLKKSATVLPEKSVTKKTGKKLNRIIITVLSLAVVFLLIERFLLSPNYSNTAVEGTLLEASIAVLPFMDMSPQGDQEYFSDGLSEELLNSLAKVKEMKVAGRTSSFKFKGQNENLTEIGEELKVNHILEGSVRKSGNRIRVTTQLIKVSDGYHIWSETYDKELTANNIFEIQDEISRNVLTELKVRLLPEVEERFKKIPTQNIDAYNLYLEGTQLVASRLPRDLESAEVKFKEAIALDENFAEAYAMLARTYGFMNQYGDLSLDEMKRLMRVNVDKAFVLDGNLGMAYHALAYLQHRSGDDVNSQKSYAKAVELMPNNANVLNGLGASFDINDPEKSIGYVKRAFELDPLDGPAASNYANYLIWTGNAQKAENILDKLIKHNPEYLPSYTKKANILSAPPNGKLDQAFIQLFPVYKEYPNSQRLVLALLELSSELDLKPYSNYLEKELVANFPATVESFGMRGQANYSSGNFKNLAQIFDSYYENYGPGMERFVSNSEIPVLYHLGKVEEAKIKIERLFPELLKDSIELSKDNYNQCMHYVQILKKLGQPEKAERFTNAFCNFTSTLKKDVEYVKTLNDEYDEVACALLRGENEKAIALYESLYFEEGDKKNYLSGKNWNLSIYELRDHPKFQELDARVKDDLHAMRAKVIQYLKKKGDWKEDWDKELENKGND